MLLFADKCESVLAGCCPQTANTFSTSGSYPTTRRRWSCSKLSTTSTACGRWRTALWSCRRYTTCCSICVLIRGLGRHMRAWDHARWSLCRLIGAAQRELVSKNMGNWESAYNGQSKPYFGFSSFTLFILKKGIVNLVLHVTVFQKNQALNLFWNNFIDFTFLLVGRILMVKLNGTY